MSDAEVEEMFLSGLERMYSGFSRADVVCFRVSRVREVFPIPTLGYSTRVPPMATSVPGVHIVTSAQIVNGTLNVNETVGLAERAARDLLGARARPGRTALSAMPDPRLGRAVRRSADGHAVAGPRQPLVVPEDSGRPLMELIPVVPSLVVPRALRFLEERNQPITWFVVGRDAAVAENRCPARLRWPGPVTRSGTIRTCMSPGCTATRRSAWTRS